MIFTLFLIITIILCGEAAEYVQDILEERFVERELKKIKYKR